MIAVRALIVCAWAVVASGCSGATLEGVDLDERRGAQMLVQRTELWTGGSGTVVFEFQTTGREAAPDGSSTVAAILISRFSMTITVGFSYDSVASNPFWATDAEPGVTVFSGGAVDSRSDVVGLARLRDGKWSFVDNVIDDGVVAQSEAQAIAQVRNTAVDVALAAAETLMRDTLTDAHRQAMADKAIQELPKRLN